MLTTSAPNRLPASSKELWVRVEASKKRLMSVRPRRSSRFLFTWRLISAALSARSRRPVISAAVKFSQVNKCRWGKKTWSADGEVLVIKPGSIGADPEAGKRIARLSTGEHDAGEPVPF